MKQTIKIHYILFLIGLVFIQKQAFAQDLEKLKSFAPKKLLANGIKIKGMLSANMSYYDATGFVQRNVPYTMLYTGNLNVDLFGKIKMPVNFSLSNRNINVSNPFDKKYQFRQPFNRLVFKPTYKGLTVHVGTCALNFSPYTLAGHRYDGVGIEYKPQKQPFYLGFMLGNLQRAIQKDSSGTIANNVPSYRRKGMGFQVGYKKNNDKLEIIYFNAGDVLTSLPYTLDDRNLYPQQNTVVSLKGGKALSKKIQFKTEVSFSGITQDSRAPERTIKNNLANTFLGTYEPKTSSDFKKALKGELLYKAKTFNTGLEYSRVEPNYRTLGAYYFVNDLETFATKLQTQLLDGKLNFSGNVGLQRDNVENQKLKTNNRWVGASNISYVPKEEINLQLAYSNFTNYSNILPAYVYLTQITPYDALDTLNFRQINQNLSLIGSFVLPSTSEDIKQTLTFNSVLQKGADSEGKTVKNNNLANISLDYGFANEPKKFTITSSVNYSNSNFNNMPSIQYGPMLGIMKGLGDNWKTNLNVMYTKGKTEGVDDTGINGRLGFAGKIFDKVDANLNLIYLNRKAVSQIRQIPSFQEFTATLGLVYNFSVLELKKK